MIEGTLWPASRADSFSMSLVPALSQVLCARNDRPPRLLVVILAKGTDVKLDDPFVN